MKKQPGCATASNTCPAMMRSDMEALMGVPPALLGHAGEAGVILGTLGGFELNLEGHAFPGWSSSEDRAAVASMLLAALPKLPREWGFCAEVAELTLVERQMLVERGQLTPTMAARQDGVHVLLNKQQDTECYINDEEHLHLQTFYPGADSAPHALKEMLEMRALMERELPVAQDPLFGNLSYDPSKSGAGIFFSFLAYLPGLRLCKHMQQVQHALDEMDIFISTLFPFQKKEWSDLWLIHAPAPSLRQEQTVLDNMNKALAALTRQELNARARLLDSAKSADKLRRSADDAYNTLSSSTRLRYARMQEALSLLRLGLYYGWFRAGEDVSEAKLAQHLSRAYLDNAPIYMMQRLGYTSPAKRAGERAVYARHLIHNVLRIAPIETYHE